MKRYQVTHRWSVIGHREKSIEVEAEYEADALIKATDPEKFGEWFAAKGEAVSFEDNQADPGVYLVSEVKENVAI